MKTTLSLTAVAVCAALFGVADSAQAKDSIDKEGSVFSWGPWAKIGSPAAGPEGVGFLNFNGPYQYDPNVVVQNSGPCGAGESCGFATYQFGREFCGYGADLAPIPAVIGLSWGPDAPTPSAARPATWDSWRFTR